MNFSRQNGDMLKTSAYLAFASLLDWNARQSAFDMHTTSSPSGLVTSPTLLSKTHF